MAATHVLDPAAPIITQSSYHPTVAVAELPPQLQSEMKNPKAQLTRRRSLLQTATEISSPSAAAAAASSLVCDGQVHEIVIPAAPYPQQFPYNNPYNNPLGVTCSRAGDGVCGAQASVDCDDRYEAVGRNRTGNVITNIGPVSQNGKISSLRLGLRLPAVQFACSFLCAACLALHTSSNRCWNPADTQCYAWSVSAFRMGPLLSAHKTC